jgi:hypothetical protein
MGGGGSQGPSYVGPTKEELAMKQQAYDAQIMELQKQNESVQQRYDAQRVAAEKALGERNTLMTQELARQKQSYDEVLGVTRDTLAKQQQAQEAQGILMKEASDKQEQAAKLQTAQTDKETVMAREGMNLNRRKVDTVTSANTTRKKRRGLMSAYTPLQGM